MKELLARKPHDFEKLRSPTNAASDWRGMVLLTDNVNQTSQSGRISQGHDSQIIMASEELFESCLNEVLEDLRSKGFAFSLKSEQRSSLRNLFEGKDLLAVLPTGFGKSLIFQLLVLMTEVRRKRRGERGFASIVVISPLQSIIRDQVVEVVSMGMTACDLNEKLDCLEEIHQGKYHIVYASAEAAMDKRFLDSLKLKDSLFNENLVACIVDESHTVETWTGLR